MDIKISLNQIKTYESLMKDLEEEPEQRETDSDKPKNNVNKSQIVFIGQN